MPTHHTWLVWKAEEVLLASTDTCRVIQGADWWLEEMGSASESHSIVQQELIGDKVLIRTVKRPTDWIGQNYLETTELPVTVLKRDGRGIWMRRGLYEMVHWYSEGPATALEAFASK